MLNKLFVLIVMCCVVYCEHSENSVFSSVEDIREAFTECDGKNFETCLKMRMLNYIDRLQTSNEVSVVDGVLLEKTIEATGGRRLDESVIDEKQLPNNTQDRDLILDELLIDKLGKFLSTHTVKFKIPKYIEDFFEDDDVNKESGRGKDKGGGQIMMIGSLLGGKMGMLAIKGLGLLTGMALVAAKIALAAATVLGLSKLLHKTEKTHVEIVKHPKVHQSHSHSHEIITPHHHHGDDYRRSMGESEDPQLLAYNGQIPQYNNGQVQQYDGQLQQFSTQIQPITGQVQQFNGQIQQNDATTQQLGMASNGDVYFYYDNSNIQNLQ